MVRLLNSAMMPAPGHYIMVQITKEEFVQALQNAYKNNNLENYVGYVQNIELIKEWTGLELKASRASTKVDDGDILLIMKLRYRVETNAKGKTVLEDDFDFFYATYSRG